MNIKKLLDLYSSNEHLKDTPTHKPKLTHVLADVAELVDALDSKSSSGNRVGVRFPPSVLQITTVP